MVNALRPLQTDFGTEGLLLHQALHGYSEGHRLLESSIPIPDDLSRLMLRMSDLSGTSVMNGFQDYLTGYPLQSLDAYALAKTWYAPEMSRPGCVWTHTFIIPVSIMSQIDSLSIVRSLFKRPNGRSIGEAYSKPVRLQYKLTSEHYERLADERLKLQSFMAAHYERESRPLIIGAANADEYAGLVFDAWSQKWPALRMSFTFCTGSLSARTFEKRPLDVQCVPTASTRQVSREIAEGGFGDPTVMEVSPLDLPRWTFLAADDALQREGGSLRHFLWSVADNDSDRADFESFVKTYSSLFDKSEPLSNVVKLTAELFPLPKDGRQLKKVLFGEPKMPLVTSIDPKEALLTLATTDHFESFDPEELCLRQQATSLIANQSALGSALLGELFRASLNPIGDEILKSLILAMSADEALLFATDQPQFVPALFRAKPELAASAQLWLAAKDRKRELFEALVALPSIEPETLRGIINAMLDSNSDGFLRRAFTQWGRPAIFQALDWSQAHGGALTENCRAALTFNVSEVASWVTAESEKSTPILTAVAHVVAPYASQIAQYDSTVWVRTLHHLPENQRSDEANYLCAFILALALSNAPPAPLDLVSESFERVHLLAEKEQLRDDAWFILQPLVPELSWRKNWDRCERMRRALMLAFMRNGWPAWQLKVRIKNPELLGELLRSARRVGAEHYFRNI